MTSRTGLEAGIQGRDLGPISAMSWHPMEGTDVVKETEVLVTNLCESVQENLRSEAVTRGGNCVSGVRLNIEINEGMLVVKGYGFVSAIND